MAKKTTKKTAQEKRVRPDLEEQISNLEAAVRPAGIKEAKEILNGYSPEVVKLAFKYLRRDERKSGPTGLGSRIESLLAGLDADEAAEMRAKLLQAKASQTKK